jgi:hypothetical protein
MKRVTTCGRWISISDLESFVAIVGDDLEETADGGDGAVQHVNPGDVAGLDLADAADRNAHRGGDAPSCHP